MATLQGLTLIALGQKPLEKQRQARCLARLPEAAAPPKERASDRDRTTETPPARNGTRETPFMTDSMAPTLFRLGRTQAVGQIDYAVSRSDTVSKQELVTVGVREIGRVQKSGAGLIERLSMLFFSLASIWVWALKALKKQHCRNGAAENRPTKSMPEPAHWPSLEFENVSESSRHCSDQPISLGECTSGFGEAFCLSRIDTRAKLRAANLCL